MDGNQGEILYSRELHRKSDTLWMVRQGILGRDLNTYQSRMLQEIPHHRFEVEYCTYFKLLHLDPQILPQLAAPHIEGQEGWRFWTSLTP